jgi:hypothetical protein
MGDRSAVPALVERVGDDAWQSINGVIVDKDAALEALKKLGPDEVEGALTAAMKSKEGVVVGWAADQLGKAAAAGKKQ